MIADGISVDLSSPLREPLAGADLSQSSRARPASAAHMRANTNSAGYLPALCGINLSDRLEREKNTAGKKSGRWNCRKPGGNDGADMRSPDQLAAFCLFI